MEYILIIDSGIGGVNQLIKIKQNFPLINIIYYCDKYYCPYGNKSKQFLKKRAITIIHELQQRYNITRVIIACNTLTMSVLPLIKKVFKIPIYGSYPPAPNVSNCLLIATNKTIKSIKKLDRYKKYTLVGLKTFASEIDNNFENTKLLENYILTNLPNLSKFDNIILGCTHYSFAITSLKKHCKTNCKFFDSNDESYYNYKNYLQNKGEGKLIVFSSCKDTRYNDKFLSLLNKHQLFIN